MKQKASIDKNKVIRITVPLTKTTVEIFKRIAKKRGTSHQRMISDILNHHAQTN